jgi:phospholipid/cholesterol/gamma-HCH transport system ATP-binding protein
LVEHTDKTAEEIDKIVRHKLEMVGLPDAGPKMPAELSGGQLKRVGLARAIAMEPEVILYDEPTTGLDPIRADTINELIIKLQKSMSVTSIVVTHDMHSVFRIADRVVMLHGGKIMFDGTPEEIRKSADPYVHDFASTTSWRGSLRRTWSRNWAEGTECKLFFARIHSLIPCRKAGLFKNMDYRV